MIAESSAGAGPVHVGVENWRVVDRGASASRVGYAQGAESVLERIAAGDDEAVGVCVERYSALVWRMARRRLAQFPSEVEDAVQEVFVELWQCAGRFDPARGCEGAFVATVAHRRLIDHQRRAAAREAGAHRQRERPGASGYAWSAGASEGGRLRACVDGLPEDERCAVWMWARGGLSHTQIAAATSSPVGTVKSRLRRAFGRLEVEMRDGGLGWVA